MLVHFKGFIAIRFITAVLVVLSLAGCFKEIAETRPPLPDLVWPIPPETPRIKFINSISRPEHMNIKESFSRKLFNFIKGKVSVSIINPYGLETDAEGRLYVVDTFLKIVHVFDPVNNSYYSFPSEKPNLISPIDIAIDHNGSIYVSDSKEGVVHRFKEYGKKYVNSFGKGLLQRPTGLAFNEISGELLVVDTKNSEIIRYDSTTLNLKGIWGHEGKGTGLFNSPTHIFVGRNGNVYITDALNFRIQIFSYDGKFIRSFGKVGDSPGFFARPRGVAVDSDDNIYVVDAMFDNIQIFNNKGDLLMDFGEPGSEYGQFWLPSGIFIDDKDNIYVSDSYNKRVQVFKYLKE